MWRIRLGVWGVRLSLLSLSIGFFGQVGLAWTEELKLSLLADSLKGHVQFLASETMKGREAGSPEERQAAEYVADRFREVGLSPMLPAGDSGTLFQAFEIPAVVNRKPVPFERRKSQNIVGWWEGSDPKLKEEFIVVGAHYDHVGMGRMTTRGGREAVGQWHPGATDNASGAACLIELAKAVAALPQARQPKRSILWMAFGAEEYGMIGSKYFAKEPTKPLKQAVAMINLAEMARGEGTAIVFTNRMKAAGQLAVLAHEPSMKIEVAPKPSQLIRSDAGPFAAAGLPCFWVTGRGSAFPDYHKPSDTVDKIDFEELAELAQFAQRLILSVANREDRIPIE